MMYFSPVDIGPLVGRARSTLEMTQEEFGQALRASDRSAQRWDAGTAEPGAHHLQTLVRLLYPKDVTSRLIPKPPIHLEAVALM
jgi:ribosome-binding protein aMBF1 (putative translation factor)